MTQDEISQNRNTIIEELRATGRQGLESLVSLLDRCGFFKARIDDTDPGEGSLANHCLWVLRLARDLNMYHRQKSSAEAPEDESLAIVCLLHHSAAQLDRSGFVLEEAEIHKSALLQEILESADRNARDYAAGIPFMAERVCVDKPSALFSQAGIYLDEEDHRLWWNRMDDGSSACHADFGAYVETPSSCVITLPVSSDLDMCDCAVVCDDNGTLALLSLFSDEEDGSILMQSDRQCFNFSDMTFYMSEYPQYRPSFVAVKRLDGKWGVLSLRKSGKKRLPLVEMDIVVRCGFRNRDAAVRSIKSRTGFPMRVTHHLFYKEFSIAECMPLQQPVLSERLDA